jgi:hypothetical protein
MNGIYFWLHRAVTEGERNTISIEYKYYMTIVYSLVFVTPNLLTNMPAASLPKFYGKIEEAKNILQN